MDRKSCSKHFDFFVLDIFAIFFSFFVAYYIRHKTLLNINIYKELILLIIASELIIYFILNPFNRILYRNNLEELILTIKKSIISFTITVILLFIIKDTNTFSRITILLMYLIYVVFSYILKFVWKKIIYRRVKKNIKSLFVICNGKKTTKIIDEISKNALDYFISGLCIVEDDAKEINNSILSLNVIRKCDIEKYVATNWIDEIFVDIENEYEYKDLINKLTIIGIPINFAITNYFDNKREKEFSKIGYINVVKVYKRKISEVEFFIKRIFDFCFAIFGSLIAIILILIIGPIIYIKSPGRILYVSKRVGKNGKVFNFYKIRSMINDADNLKNSLMNKNTVKDNLMFKIKDDPRIIPGIGEFIRKTSLDEFPQFFNVLKGDMSIIGTRPPTLDEWNKYNLFYRSRLSFFPGITGLWQISGRSNITNFDEVVSLDNKYIENWSLVLDIKIFLKTIIQLFKKNNGAM